MTRKWINIRKLLKKLENLK